MGQRARVQSSRDASRIAGSLADRASTARCAAVGLAHAVQHKALSDARRKGTLARDVAEVADAPKLRSAVKRQEIKVWTPEELCRFRSPT